MIGRFVDESGYSRTDMWQPTADSGFHGSVDAETLRDLKDVDFRDLVKCMMDLREFGFCTSDPDMIRRAVARARALKAERDDTDEARERQRSERTLADAYAAQSQVYYVDLGRLIKIGYSTNMVQRLIALRADRAAVLATEPGGRMLEHVRHTQFADDRVGRREDFRKSRRLMDHIWSVQRRCGAPKVTTYIDHLSLTSVRHG